MGWANKTGWMKRRRGKFAKSYPRFNRVANVGGKVFGLQRQVNFIKGLVNSELYTADTTANINPSSTGSIIPLNEIAQGDDVGNRTGNSILAKSLLIRIIAAMNATAITTFVRIIVFQDTSSLGTLPTVGDVLQTVSTTAPLDVDHFGRYVILRDKLLSMDDSSRQTFNLKWFLRLNTHIKFTGTTASDYYKNSLFMLILSDQATNTPSLEYNVRLRYHDN